MGVSTLGTVGDSANCSEPDSMAAASGWHILKLQGREITQSQAVATPPARQGIYTAPHSTLNSRILIIRTPRKVPLIFGNSQFKKASDSLTLKPDKSRLTPSV